MEIWGLDPLKQGQLALVSSAISSQSGQLGRERGIGVGAANAGTSRSVGSPSMSCKQGAEFSVDFTPSSKFGQGLE